jgi:hypothetical protein
MKTLFSNISHLYTKVFYVLMTALTFVPNIFAELVSRDSITSGVVKERIDIDYGMEILRSREKSVFLQFLLRNLANVKEDQAVTSYNRQFEQRPKRRQFVTKAGVTTGNPGSPIDIGTAGEEKVLTFNAGDTLNIQEGHLITIKGLTLADSTFTNDAYVTNVTSTTITVAPNDITKKFPVIGAVKTIFVRTTSAAQNADTQLPISRSPDLIENVTEIFRNPFGSSKTVENERMYGGETERERKRIEAELDHCMDIEYAYLFNGPMVIVEAGGGDAGNAHRGTLEGIETTLLKGIADGYKNCKNYSGTAPTLAEMRSWALTVFNQKLVDGPQGRRILLTNNAGADWFWEQNQSKIQTTPDTTVFGQSVDSAKIGGGEFLVHVHPLIQEMYDDTTKPYFMALHPRFIKEKVLRSTRLQANIQNASTDGFLDEFLTESTIMTSMKEMHGLFGHTTMFTGAV